VCDKADSMEINRSQFWCYLLNVGPVVMLSIIVTYLIILTLYGNDEFVNVIYSSVL